MTNQHDEQFDDDEILRDGHRHRVPMTMRDAALSGTARGNRITDGRSNDPMALHRPGHRIPTIADRRAVHDAYVRYEADLITAYRGDGLYGEGSDEDGDDDGDECEACSGTGTIAKTKKKIRSTKEDHADHRTLDQTMRDHQARMNQLYADRDRQDSEAWRA